MGKDKSLGDRMKEYESCYGFKIPNRSYVIIRLDGKGFSKYTKAFDKPFDDLLSISPSLQEPFNEYNFYLPLSPSFSTSANEILNENSLSKQSNSWVLI